MKSTGPVFRSALIGLTAILPAPTASTSPPRAAGLRSTCTPILQVPSPASVRSGLSRVCGSWTVEATPAAVPSPSAPTDRMVDVQPDPRGRSGADRGARTRSRSVNSTAKSTVGPLALTVVTGSGVVTPPVLRAMAGTPDSSAATTPPTVPEWVARPARWGRSRCPTPSDRGRDPRTPRTVRRPPTHRECRSTARGVHPGPQASVRGVRGAGRQADGQATSSVAEPGTPIPLRALSTYCRRASRNSWYA